MDESRIARSFIPYENGRGRGPFRFGMLDILRDWPEVRELVSCSLIDDTTGILAVDDTGEIAAVVVMDSWTQTSVQLHSCIRNPFVIRHGFLHKVFDALFIAARRSVVFGLVPGNNQKALKFNQHIGFSEVSRLKEGYDHGIDYVIMEMRRENCRWIEGRHHDG